VVATTIINIREMASFIDNIIVGIKKEEEYDKVVEKVVFDSNTAA